MKSEKPTQVVCPNCENEFDKHFDFCPHCGQKNKKINLHLNYFIHDFLSGAFNLDSKFFLTFKTLILFPGKLSEEFLLGKRTKYLPPVRTYLIVSLFTLHYFLFSLRTWLNSVAMKIN